MFAAGRESHGIDSSVTTYILLPATDREKMQPNGNAEAHAEKRVREIAAEVESGGRITIAPLMANDGTAGNGLDTMARHIAGIFRALLPDATVAVIPEYSGASELLHNGIEHPAEGQLRNGIAIIVMSREKR